MEIDSSVTSDEKTRFVSWLMSPPKELVGKAVETAREIAKLAREDPRRVVHSLKVGLALTMVSLLYYFDPTYSNLGVSAMWAVMTVVVVFEYSVGATLSKGLNRGMATLLAGALGILAHRLASLSGKIGEPILLSFFVFIHAASFTFMRFYPKIKARYDYGMLVFILTFSLVSVSGYRDDEILQLAHKRLCTVVLGGVVCILVSVVTWPVWAGEDLHNLIVLNMEKLGNFLEAFGDAYFKTTSDNGEISGEDLSLKGYKSVLSSKSNEESLANFARWEPGHGRFRFWHPWKQYLKIGTLVRQCAYRIEALDGCLNNKFQAPPQVRERMQEACMRISTESAKTIKELSISFKKMTDGSHLVGEHLENCKTAVKTLESLLKASSWDDELDLLSVVPVATVASLLIDVTECLEKITEAVNELASLAKFKSVEAPVVVSLKRVHTMKVEHVVIDVGSEATGRDSAVANNGSGN